MTLKPIQGNWASSRVDLGYNELFHISAVTSVSSRLLTVFLGTLRCSIKQSKPPSVFDGEHGIALHAMQGFGPQLESRRKSYGFSRVAVGTWCIFSSYSRHDLSKLVCFQRLQDSCPVASDTSRIYSRLGKAIMTLLEVRQETEDAFLVATVILAFLSIFNKSKSSSPFEALNSACLSRFQRDVRSPLQMRVGPRVFTRVTTGDSDIPSSCEMKDKPAFKSLQGNLTFFQFRATQYPFHLRQQTQGPSHIPIPEGSLLWRCLWKVGLPFQSKPGNQLSSRDNMQCTDLSSSCCAEIGVPLDLRRMSQGISGVA